MDTKQVVALWRETTGFTGMEEKDGFVRVIRPFAYEQAEEEGYDNLREHRAAAKEAGVLAGELIGSRIVDSVMIEADRDIGRIALVFDLPLGGLTSQMVVTVAQLCLAHT